MVDISGERIMAEFPALPLWTDAYLGDTTHLSTIEHGAYLLLLMVAWRSKDGMLPNDDKLLARYTKLTLQQWKRIRPILEPFFVVSLNGWCQGRLIDELVAVKQLSKNQSKKAKARWLKNNNTNNAAASGGHSQNQNGHSPADTSPTPTPFTQLKDKESFSVSDAHTLPEFKNLELEGELSDIATEAKLTGDAATRCWRKFKIHFGGNPPADVPKAWHIWVLNEYIRPLPGEPHPEEKLTEEQVRIQTLGAANWKRQKKLPIDPHEVRLLERWENENEVVWWTSLKDYKPRS